MGWWGLARLLALLHPNDRNVETVSPAREAGNYFVRRQMLAHAVRGEGQGKRKRVKAFVWRESNQNVGVGHTCERTETAEKPSPPREQEHFGGYLPRVKHPHTPARPIPSLEFADGKSAYRNTRMMRMYNLSFLHAPLAVSLSVSTCSLMPCLPRAASRLVRWRALPRCPLIII